MRSSGSGAFAAFDCSLTNNGAGFSGGALSLNTSGACTIEGCTFASNFTNADAGVNQAGGAINNGSALTIRKSTFHGNSTFAGNTSLTAGAIRTSDGAGSGALTLEHCTITGNVSGGASSFRAAIAIMGTASAVVRNSILAENTGGVAGIGGADLP